MGLRAAVGSREGDHLVEDQHDAKSRRDVAQPLQELCGGRHHARGPHDRFHQDGSEVRALALEDGLCFVRVVERELDHVLRHARRHTGGHSGGVEADRRVTDDQHVGDAVVAALRLGQLGPSCVRARETQRKQVRLGPRGEEAHSFDGRHPLDEERGHAVREPPFRASQLCRAVELLDDGVAHRLVAVPECHDPVPDAHVEVTVAVDVPHARALPALEQHRIGQLVPHPAGVAGGDQRLRLLEQLKGTAGALAVAPLSFGV